RPLRSRRAPHRRVLAGHGTQGSRNRPGHLPRMHGGGCVAGIRPHTAHVDRTRMGRHRTRNAVRERGDPGLMDITDTITPNSEQLNAEDLLVGPRTYTVTGVEEGTADQPVFIHLSEVPGRTYRPGKSMRRV